MVETFIVKQVFPLTEFDGREGKVKALPMILAGASGEIYLEVYNDRAEKLSSEGICNGCGIAASLNFGVKSYTPQGQQTSGSATTFYRTQVYLEEFVIINNAIKGF